MRYLDMEQLKKQKQRLYEELSAVSAGSRKYKRLLKSYLLVYEHLKFYNKNF